MAPARARGEPDQTFSENWTISMYAQQSPVGQGLPSIAVRLPSLASVTKSDKIPLVSVVMPARNGARYLTEAVDSILRQSMSDLELLIIDDGSTDDTPALLRKLASSDSRVSIYHQAGDGLVAALNRGIAEARAPLIARMDCDDVAAIDRLERQLSAFESRPRLVAVGGQATQIDEAGGKLGCLRYPVGAQAIRRQLTLSSPFCHPAVTFRKAAVLAVGGYRKAYRHAEDYDLWLRLFEVGELDNLNVVVLDYRRHQNSTTNRHAAEQAQKTALASVAAHSRANGLPDPTPAGDWASSSFPEELDVIGATPTQRRLALLVYWRTLVLNGGLNNPAGLSAFRQALPHLNTAARLLSARYMFAFIMMRAAFLATQSKQRLLAAECAFRSVSVAPAATAHQFIMRLARPRI